MVVKSSKIGAILGLIGSTILLVVGLASVSFARNAYHPDPYFPVFIPYITAFVTVALSAFGLLGTILVFRDIPMGYIFLLIAGIVGIIGTLLPIYIYVYDDGYGYTYTYMNFLVGTALYTDLILMVVGGILGFALAEKKERIK